MSINLPQINYGKLKGRIKDEKNIVYYRRGLEELSLNVTNACPNACAFCIRDRDQGWGVSNLYLSRDPSIEEIMQAYDEESEKILALGVDLKKIKICGYGEPILRFEDLKPIARHIRKKGSNDNLEVQITTTGWPYFRFISPDKERISELKEAGVSHIYLSVNALDKKNYDKLVRPGINEIDSDAFSDTLKFGEGAKEAGLDVTLGFIRLGKITDEEVKSFAERYGMKYRLRDFEE